MTAGRERVAADSVTARFSFVDLVLELLDEKRAEDIVWLDISEVTSLAARTRQESPRKMLARR